MIKNRNTTTTVVYCALFTALVFAATAYISIPLSIGYVNLGDAVIFAAASLLGPLAAVAGAVGAALADFAAGYGIYAPATLTIKAVMGLVAAQAFRGGHRTAKKLALFGAAEFIMIGGYFAYECAIYGVAGAATGLLPNLLQGVFGIAAGFLLSDIIIRVSEKVGARL